MSEKRVAEPAAHLLAGAATEPDEHTDHEADQDEGFDKTRHCRAARVGARHLDLVLE
jgi:hypothetical protein